MLHAKKLAVTALAALMIAGAVPAFASADTDVSSNTSTAQEEVVTETAKKPHKKRVKPSSDTGDSTDATRPSRRKSDAATNSDGTESSDTAQKRVKPSSDTGDSTDATRPSRRKSDAATNSDGTEIPDAVSGATQKTVTDDGQKERPSRRPARKPAKKTESAATDTNPAETAV